MESKTLFTLTEDAILAAFNWGNALSGKFITQADYDYAQRRALETREALNEAQDRMRALVIEFKNL